MISEEEKKVAGIIPYGTPTPSTTVHNLRPNWIDLGLNYNSIPYASNAAIICTSHPGQLVFLKAVLTGYRLTGKFTICSFDTTLMPWATPENWTNQFPTPDLFKIPHAWVFKHPTFDNPKRNGWFWDVKYGQGIINEFDNIEYVFTVNGDCVWETPERVDELILLMEGFDLMAASSGLGLIHTCAVLYKKEAFNKIINFMSDKHHYSVIGSYSPERLLKEAVKDLGLSEKIVPAQPMEEDGQSVDHYSRRNQPSTWKEIVGYRNLGAEYLTAVIERCEPPEKKYMDMRFIETLFSHDRTCCKNYYETGDRRYLYMCWDRSEDSWYDRVFYPIEKYGKDPIYKEE